MHYPIHRDGSFADILKELTAFWGIYFSYLLLARLSIFMIPEHLAPIQEDTRLAVNYT